MKYLIIICLILCSCNGQSENNTISDTKPVTKQIAEDNYNKETDFLINSVLNRNPVVTIDRTPSTTRYNITGQNIRIQVYHDKHVDFEKRENWEFFAKYKDGRLIMIQSSLGVEKHTVSPATFDRIKSFCLKHGQ